LHFVGAGFSPARRLPARAGDAPRRVAFVAQSFAAFAKFCGFRTALTLSSRPSRLASADDGEACLPQAGFSRAEKDGKISFAYRALHPREVLPPRFSFSSGGGSAGSIVTHELYPSGPPSPLSLSSGSENSTFASFITFRRSLTSFGLTAPKNVAPANITKNTALSHLRFIDICPPAHR
jgi:hypothetical protein